MMESCSNSYSAGSFYVIVEPSVMDDRQLRLPDKFVQEHGDELLDTVKIIVPTDDFWSVGVKKAGKMIWLHDGWQEFMEHHSVNCWYFLLFKYGQTSCFNVHIFDLAATEVDYQLRSHGNAKSRDVAQDLSHGKDKIAGDKGVTSSVEIVDLLETEQGPESSAKSSELSHRAKRRKIASGKIKISRCYETRSRTNKLHDNGQLLNAKNLNISGNGSLTKPVGGKLVRRSMKTPIHSAVATGDTRKSFTSKQREKSVGLGRYDRRERAQQKASETSRAIQTAKMFIPENPYFLQILEKYNIVRNYILNLPVEFVRKYMPKTSELIELQDTNGNKWNVRCIRRKHRVLLSKGWLNFVTDNSLLVGDVCVFELIKDVQADELMLKVHMFRNRVEENSKNLHTGSLSEPTLSTGKNCILQFDESKHTESSDAFEPLSSDRTNHKTDTENSSGQQQEKSVVHGSSGNRRKRGRPRDAEANTDTENSSGQQQEKSVVHGSSGNRRKRGRPRDAEANRATTAAKMFTPENPYFMITLGEYHVVRNYILNIPPEFVRDYMPKTSEPIKLQNSDGNKWTAHCLRRKTYMFLSKGWVHFVRDNSLVLGDACVFELIKGIQADELMLKVHIFRNKVEQNSII
ncbi:B3 domain-containing transcription factor VRN1-like [Solanum stenotomum]|uniref:B3 domain-containing transcription factor VRN1-like n=1 Tax=Solanum stenotomum TaxID=172797 RepID=UPI0020D11FA4|nr:B3 domain-containing transcription factor VRN1-like [Solanum stenotomum]